MGRAPSRRLLLACALAIALIALFAPGAASAATITVNTTDDPGFRDITTCNGVPGDCSLRDAANKANDDADEDTIVVPAGHYTLKFGEIGLYRQETVQGAGARDTIIDGNGDARYVFALNSPDNIELPRVTLTNMTVTGGADRGINAFTSVTLLRVAVEGNTGGFRAELPSEVKFPSTPDMRIVDSTISGNTGTGAGGVLMETGALTVVNSTITGNVGVSEGGDATAAGGISFDATADSMLLLSSTIADNSVGEGDEGVANILVVGSGIGSVGLRDTIVSRAGTDDNCAGPVNSQGHNLIDDDSCGADPSQGDLLAEPLLEALANNGAGTDTLALSPNSPALDAGDPNGCTDDNDLPLGFDQRGVGRPQGAHCDIGAYESAKPGSTTGDASNVTYHSATISGNGTNPNPFDGTAHFEYGKTTDYGNQTGDDTIKAGTGGPGAQNGALAKFLTGTVDPADPGHFTADLDGLDPLTTYHYRLVITNPDGTSFGADRTFTTGKAPDPDPGPGPGPTPEPQPTPDPGPTPRPHKPNLRVSSLTAGCYRNGLSARIRVHVSTGTKLRRLTIELDGKRLFRTNRKRIVLRLNVRALGAGSHRLVVRATDSGGRTTAARRSFSRCRVRHSGPKFTG